MKISIDDYIYPQILKKIKKPPKNLYLIGNVELLQTNCFAIIGSRKCTKYGEKMAKKFASDLTKYNITIISGMAEGIDSIAHNSCLDFCGNTIAVLPSGFNKIYPEENKYLFNKILKQNGLIISEYDENVEADYNKFLERNRIISGLSIGILVVEGGYRSGTSVTARIAKEQEKNVFCVPSSLENIKGITPNNLIKNGAYLVTEVEDIIAKYDYLNLHKNENKFAKSNYLENNDEIYTELNNNENSDEIYIEQEYEEIFKILNKDKKIHINEIVKKLKMNIKDVNSKLMMLELEGKIEELPGNYFKRT